MNSNMPTPNIHEFKYSHFIRVCFLITFGEMHLILTYMNPTKLFKVLAEAFLSQKYMFLKFFEYGNILSRSFTEAFPANAYS